MTACDHIEKLKAKRIAAEKAVILSAQLHRAAASGWIQRSVLRVRVAERPPEIDPSRPLKRLISQAAFPSGSSDHSQARNVHSG
jgi:hypothetical protein